MGACSLIGTKSTRHWSAKVFRRVNEPRIRLAPSAPSSKTKRPKTHPSRWDVRSNSPPPKPAQSQSTKRAYLCEWPNRASDADKSRGAHPRSNTAFSTSVTPRTSHCASRKNKGNSCLMMQRLWSEQDGQDIAAEQRKLMLDDAEVMVGAGRSRHR
jgi:hypothetical protein